MPWDFLRNQIRASFNTNNNYDNSYYGSHCSRNISPFSIYQEARYPTNGSYQNRHINLSNRINSLIDISHQRSSNSFQTKPGFDKCQSIRYPNNVKFKKIPYTKPDSSRKLSRNPETKITPGTKLVETKKASTKKVDTEKAYTDLKTKKSSTKEVGTNESDSNSVQAKKDNIEAVKTNKKLCTIKLDEKKIEITVTESNNALETRKPGFKAVETKRVDSVKKSDHKEAGTKKNDGNSAQAKNYDIEVEETNKEVYRSKSGQKNIDSTNIEREKAEVTKNLVSKAVETNQSITHAVHSKKTNDCKESGIMKTDSESAKEKNSYIEKAKPNKETYKSKSDKYDSIDLESKTSDVNANVSKKPEVTSEEVETRSKSDNKGAETTKPNHKEVDTKNCDCDSTNHKAGKKQDNLCFTIQNSKSVKKQTIILSPHVEHAFENTRNHESSRSQVEDQNVTDEVVFEQTNSNVNPCKERADKNVGANTPHLVSVNETKANLIVVQNFKANCLKGNYRSSSENTIDIILQEQSYSDITDNEPQKISLVNNSTQQSSDTTTVSNVEPLKFVNPNSCDPIIKGQPIKVVNSFSRKNNIRNISPLVQTYSSNIINLNQQQYLHVQDKSIILPQHVPLVSAHNTPDSPSFQNQCNPVVETNKTVPYFQKFSCHEYYPFQSNEPQHHNQPNPYHPNEHNFSNNHAYFSFSDLTESRNIKHQSDLINMDKILINGGPSINIEFHQDQCITVNPSSIVLPSKSNPKISDSKTILLSSESHTSMQLIQSTPQNYPPKKLKSDIRNSENIELTNKKRQQRSNQKKLNNAENVKLIEECISQTHCSNDSPQLSNSNFYDSIDKTIDLMKNKTTFELSKNIMKAMYRLHLTLKGNGLENNSIEETLQTLYKNIKSELLKLDSLKGNNQDNENLALMRLNNSVLHFCNEVESIKTKSKSPKKDDDILFPLASEVGIKSKKNQDCVQHELSAEKEKTALNTRSLDDEILDFLTFGLKKFQQKSTVLYDRIHRPTVLRKAEISSSKNPPMSLISSDISSDEISHFENEEGKYSGRPLKKISASSSDFCNRTNGGYKQLLEEREIVKGRFISREKFSSPSLLNIIHKNRQIEPNCSSRYRREFISSNKGESNMMADRISCNPSKMIVSRSPPSERSSIKDQRPKYNMEWSSSSPVEYERKDHKISRRTERSLSKSPSEWSSSSAVDHERNYDKVTRHIERSVSKSPSISRSRNSEQRSRKKIERSSTKSPVQCKRKYDKRSLSKSPPISRSRNFERRSRQKVKWSSGSPVEYERKYNEIPSHFEKAVSKSPLRSGSRNREQRSRRKVERSSSSPQYKRKYNRISRRIERSLSNSPSRSRSRNFEKKLRRNVERSSTSPVDYERRYNEMAKRLKSLSKSPSKTSLAVKYERIGKKMSKRPVSFLSSPSNTQSIKNEPTKHYESPLYYTTKGKHISSCSLQNSERRKSKENRELRSSSPEWSPSSTTQLLNIETKNKYGNVPIASCPNNLEKEKNTESFISRPDSTIKNKRRPIIFSSSPDRSLSKESHLCSAVLCPHYYPREISESSEIYRNNSGMTFDLRSKIKKRPITPDTIYDKADLYNKAKQILIERNFEKNCTPLNHATARIQKPKHSKKLQDLEKYFTIKNRLQNWKNETAKCTIDVPSTCIMNPQNEGTVDVSQSEICEIPVDELKQSVDDIIDFVETKLQSLFSDDEADPIDPQNNMIKIDSEEDKMIKDSDLRNILNGIKERKEQLSEHTEKNEKSLVDNYMDTNVISSTISNVNPGIKDKHILDDTCVNYESSKNNDENVKNSMARNIQNPYSTEKALSFDNDEISSISKYQNKTSKQNASSNETQDGETKSPVTVDNGADDIHFIENLLADIDDIFDKDGSEEIISSHEDKVRFDGESFTESVKKSFETTQSENQLLKNSLGTIYDNNYQLSKESKIYSTKSSQKSIKSPFRSTTKEINKGLKTPIHRDDSKGNNLKKSEEINNLKQVAGKKSKIKETKVKAYQNENVVKISKVKETKGTKSETCEKSNNNTLKSPSKDKIGDNIDKNYKDDVLDSLAENEFNLMKQFGPSSNTREDPEILIKHAVAHTPSGESDFKHSNMGHTSVQCILSLEEKNHCNMSETESTLNEICVSTMKEKGTPYEDMNQNMGKYTEAIKCNANREYTKNELNTNVFRNKRDKNMKCNFYGKNSYLEKQKNGAIKNLNNVPSILEKNDADLHITVYGNDESIQNYPSKISSQAFIKNIAVPVKEISNPNHSEMIIESELCYIDNERSIHFESNNFKEKNVHTLCTDISSRHERPEMQCHVQSDMQIMRKQYKFFKSKNQNNRPVTLATENEMATICDMNVSKKGEHEQSRESKKTIEQTPVLVKFTDIKPPIKHSSNTVLLDSFVHRVNYEGNFKPVVRLDKMDIHTKKTNTHKSEDSLHDKNNQNELKKIEDVDVILPFKRKPPPILQNKFKFPEDAELPSGKNMLPLKFRPRSCSARDIKKLEMGNIWQIDDFEVSGFSRKKVLPAQTYNSFDNTIRNSRVNTTRSDKAKPTVTNNSTPIAKNVKTFSSEGMHIFYDPVEKRNKILKNTTTKYSALREKTEDQNKLSNQRIFPLTTKRRSCSHQIQNTLPSTEVIIPLKRNQRSCTLKDQSSSNISRDSIVSSDEEIFSLKRKLRSCTKKNQNDSNLSRKSKLSSDEKILHLKRKLRSCTYDQNDLNLLKDSELSSDEEILPLKRISRSCTSKQNSSKISEDPEMSSDEEILPSKRKLRSCTNDQNDLNLLEDSELSSDEDILPLKRKLRSCSKQNS